MPLRREKSTANAGYLSIELNDLHIPTTNSLTSANGRQPGVASGNTVENGPVSDSAVADLADEVNLIDMNTPEMERRNLPQGPSPVTNGGEQASTGGATGGSVEERTEPTTSSVAAQGVALLGLATGAATAAAGSRTSSPGLTPSTSHPLTQPRHSPAPSPTPSPTPPQASLLIHYRTYNVGYCCILSIVKSRSLMHIVPYWSRKNRDTKCHELQSFLNTY